MRVLSSIDGADMTSADVKATFDRIIFPPDHVSSRRQALFAAVAADGVQAPDEHTFQLVLEEPRAADFILNAFATGFNVIVRKQTLEDNDYDLRTIPDYPGTGPYRYNEHRDAEFWKIEANPDYWNPNLPYMDGINVYHIPDTQARIAAFLAKKSDYSRVIEPQVLPRVAGRPAGWYETAPVRADNGTGHLDETGYGRSFERCPRAKGDQPDYRPRRDGR